MLFIFLKDFLKDRDTSSLSANVSAPTDQKSNKKQIRQICHS